MRVLAIFMPLYYYKQNSLDTKQYGKDTMRILFLSLFITAALVSCATEKSFREDFDKVFMGYNDLLRWHKLEDLGLFPVDSISEKYRERLEMAKDVKVVDYRIMNVTFDDKKKEAAVKIELDYYTLSWPTIRTVVDNQKWAYKGEKDKGEWRLMSLLPEFP
jgi:hypothetical protein